MVDTLKLLLVLGIVWTQIMGPVAGQQSQQKRNISIRKKYELSEGRSVHVLDDALPEQLVLSLIYFMTGNDNWRYVLHDPHSMTQEHVYDDRNGIPWKSWKDPTLLMKTNVGQKLASVVRSINEKSKNVTANFELNEVYAAISRRGDRTNLVAEGDRDDDSYHVALFTNIVWRKNGYGELLLYDDDGEILTSVRPKFGRIVVWHSSIPYILRPASIAQLSTQAIIMMNFGSDVDTNVRKIKYYKSFVDEIRRPPSLLSWVEEYKNPPAVEVDLEKHLTMYRTNKRNHFVAVFDGLFNKASLSALRAWTIKYGLYFFDGSLDTSSDNVQWIAGISIDDFMQTDFWPIIHKMAVYVSNSTNWYPYDVACNLIRSYDHTRFHLDTSESTEKEMTFLLYLSPNWTSADYGETAFMERNDDHKLNEYVAEVVPTFGRAVIFDGNFPHSAHPPSVLHHNARYTLAVKLSYNKLLASEKTFKEEKQHEPGIASSVANLKELKNDPQYYVATAKVQQVANHLATRNVLRRVSGADYSEEGKLSVNTDVDGKSDQEKDIHLPFVNLEELEVTLTHKQKKILLAMSKLHKIRDPSYIARLDELKDQFLMNFEEEVRQQTLARWHEISGDNGDMLNDYLELYLRQRLWLKDYVMGKMTTLL